MARTTRCIHADPRPGCGRTRWPRLAATRGGGSRRELQFHRGRLREAWGAAMAACAAGRRTPRFERFRPCQCAQNISMSRRRPLWRDTSMEARFRSPVLSLSGSKRGAWARDHRRLNSSLIRKLIPMLGFDRVDLFVLMWKEPGIAWRGRSWQDW